MVDLGIKISSICCHSKVYNATESYKLKNLTKKKKNRAFGFLVDKLSKGKNSLSAFVIIVCTCHFLMIF